MITSVACTLLFPDHFTLNFLFVCCLLLMFSAIFMYENKNMDVETLKEKVCGKKRKERRHYLIVICDLLVAFNQHYVKV